MSALSSSPPPSPIAGSPIASSPPLENRDQESTAKMVTKLVLKWFATMGVVFVGSIVGALVGGAIGTVQMPLVGSCIGAAIGAMVGLGTLFVLYGEVIAPGIDRWVNRLFS
ncbi:MAG TPA: hypothetical protein VLF94_05045 [Chlamydiales bacterium]|nr:hypothetical protein [Chlamydiales bacterium]